MIHYIEEIYNCFMSRYDRTCTDKGVLESFQHNVNECNEKIELTSNKEKEWKMNKQINI